MEEIEGPLLIKKLLIAFGFQPASATTFLPLVTAWLVVAIWVALAAVMVRKLTLRPAGIQNFMELALENIARMADQTAGHEGRRFLPLFATLFLFILTSNFLGLIPGFMSPTANVNINAAMALIVAFSTEFLSIRQKGALGYLKHLCGPPYWLAPMFVVIRVMEVFSRPLSLTMRLFGNMLAKEIMLGVLVYMITLFFFASGVVPKLLLVVAAALRPAIILLGVLVGFVQAMVFTILAMSYIGSAFETHH